MKKARHKRSHIIGFPFYEMSRTGIENKGQLLNGHRVPFEGMKYFGTR